ncbi:hypothetical protein DPMN_066357 [Dreissena polymorpha]|uniref:B box-type domain-containing protein n=1 Tax=Dreissena polymorpha TaxID=45954 RepID=A0A9D4BKE9_DREPO|nr:hypothetical protein DPMN_066357 [Dreissena polymorpha]
MAQALKCGPCSFVEEEVDPKHFCVDCLEYLCTGCARDHKKHKTLRGHRILNETDLSARHNLIRRIKLIVTLFDTR